MLRAAVRRRWARTKKGAGITYGNGKTLKNRNRNE